MAEKIKNIIIQTVQCLRCGHTWIPRKRDIKVCPKCKSPYWNEPKQLGADKQ